MSVVMSTQRKILQEIWRSLIFLVKAVLMEDGYENAIGIGSSMNERRKLKTDGTENYFRDLTTKVNREMGYEEITYLYIDPNNPSRDRKQVLWETEEKIAELCPLVVLERGCSLVPQ